MWIHRIYNKERSVITTVKQWPNRAAARIPPSVAKATRLDIGESADVREQAGRIVIEPVHVPAAGDIVWLSSTPQAGHRPAPGISPAACNNTTSLVIRCPRTMQIENEPFEVLDSGASRSVVLADQIKSVDSRVRKATRKGSVSAEERAEMRAKIGALSG